MIWLWNNWRTSLTLFFWFFAALGLKEQSQPGEIVPFIFYFNNSRFCFIYGLLHCCGDSFFAEVGTQPNVVFLLLVRFWGWVVMKNNGTCNALKCLKPSGLIEWVNCRLCNGWVRIKCANLSRTEARRLAKFQRFKCSLVTTIPQCHYDNFRPDTFFNSGVVHLKTVLKTSRIPLAENLIPIHYDICETPSNLVNVILEGKVPFENRPYFFGAKLIALKGPDGGLLPMAVGNTFRRLSARCTGYHVVKSRQA